MSVARAFTVALIAVSSTACGLTEQPTVNTAELLVETQDVVLGLREELAAFQDQLDSLRVELSRQDSLLRLMANLQGMPMPPRTPTIIPQ